MKISSMNWFQVEEYLKKDDRCVLPIGSTEQHAYLSLCTDNILAEKVAVDAAESTGVPVFPVLNYGFTPLFMSYPGTVTLKLETLRLVVLEILDSIVRHGFRRILIVNGHGGNIPIENSITEWMTDKPDVKIIFHSWFKADKTWKKVLEIDPVASHASWMENFKWTRLEDVDTPDIQKEMVNFEKLKIATADEAKQMLTDGNYGGYFQRDDNEMNELWNSAVAETRDLLENGWA